MDRCEREQIVPLLQNIIITGGTTMFAGLAARITKELGHELTMNRYGGDPERVKKTGMEVHDPPRRKHAVFIGASFLASHIAEEQWISKAEYEEKGAPCLWQH